MSIFMKLDGISGSATAKGYEGWAELHSIRFAMQRDIPFNVGQNKSRPSVPTFQHIAMTKSIDASSAGLVAALCKNTLIATVQIDLCHTGENLPPYLQYTLHNVLIADLETIATAANGLVETLLLNYTKIDKRYALSDSSGRKQSAATIAYDLTNAKAS